MTCLEGRTLVGHYYPYCPQPDLTVGIASHTDPGFLTILLQDHLGGLQIKSGDVWVDVKPVPGALLINIGDLVVVKIKLNNLIFFFCQLKKWITLENRIKFH